MSFFSLELINYLLLGTTLANFFSSLLLIFNFKNVIARSLFFTLLFTGFWSLVINLYFISDSAFEAEIYFKFANVFALLLVISLYYFSVNFPYHSQPLHRNFSRIVVIIGFLIGVINPEIVKSVILRHEVYHIISSPIYYALYGVVLIIFLAQTIQNLYVKFIRSSGIMRKHISMVLTAVSIATGVGLLFAFVFPYISNFTYLWLGPISSLAMNGVLYIVVFNLFKNRLSA